MTVVYTAIVGDRLTHAHTQFLRRARSLGDRLIVGVFSDDDCEWFHRRPERSLADRAGAVAECISVDRVVPGAPVRPTVEWLRASGIGWVVHSGALHDDALRYWHRGASELGILCEVRIACDDSSTDVEGHLRKFEPREVRAESPMSRLRRMVRHAMPRLDRAIRAHFFRTGLQRMADVLQGTPIDGRYWVVGGLLLGWARQGRPLDADLDDVDFAYLDEDHDRFLASIPSLVGAGFQPRHRFSSADGRYVEHRFRRRNVQFDFFRLQTVGERWRYSLFVIGEQPVEMVAEVPVQPRVPFSLLDRQWLKVADHDLALRTIYGDWRRDEPEWTYTSDRAIVSRIPVAILPYEWRWPQAITQGPGESASHTPHVSVVTAD